MIKICQEGRKKHMSNIDIYRQASAVHIHNNCESGQLCSIPLVCLLSLETYYTSFRSQFDQFWGSCQGHVGIEIFFAQLASFKAGGSDEDRHLIFNQIG